MANWAGPDLVLVIALAALFVNGTLSADGKSDNGSSARYWSRCQPAEEAALLSCSQVRPVIPSCAVSFTFQRTVSAAWRTCTTDEPRPSLVGHPALRESQRPPLLAAVQTYDDKLTLQSVCRQFRQMSQRLHQKSPRRSATNTHSHLAASSRIDETGLLSG